MANMNALHSLHCVRLATEATKLTEVTPQPSSLVVEGTTRALKKLAW